MPLEMQKCNSCKPGKAVLQELSDCEVIITARKAKVNCFPSATSNMLLDY